MPAVKYTEIRDRRQRLGMKLGEFAEHAGVNYHTLKNIECGNKAPGIELVHRLAAVFGCDADDLLDKDVPRPSRRSRAAHPSSSWPVSAKKKPDGIRHDAECASCGKRWSPGHACKQGSAAA